MDNVRLRYLLAKRVTDTISPEELDELFALLEKTDLETQEEVLTDILKGKELEHRLPLENKELLYESIRQAVLKDQANTRPNRSVTFKKYISIAAALVVGLSTLLWLWKKSEFDGRHTTENVDLEVANVTDDIYIAPDSVPFLRLPNGEIQVLEDDQPNALAETGVKILQGKDGEIIYEVQHAPLGLFEEENIVFTTPKGQSSKILLIDGTEVWLNSGSSLTYPRVFSSKERRVKLVGEGYFDVAHNTEKPFYVETTNGPLIRVLGTAFNVSAYQEDRTTTTTLVKGTVQLEGKHHKVVLKPSEQVTANENDAVLHKKSVQVDDFTTWKDGYFNFNEQSIPQILAKVQRWYNIEEISYDYMSDEKFTGTFKRTKSLKSLLLKLEKISNVKFQIKERRVVVTK